MAAAPCESCVTESQDTLLATACCDCEEVELIAIDGDSKEEAKHQIVANMNKCLAYAAVARGIHFNKITVIGLLVSYSKK